MHIERYGVGPHTYFGIHGWAGHHATFKRLLPYMPPSVSFYCCDLPGYGASPRPPVWSLDAVSGALIDAMRGLDAPLTVVGYCGGANLAIEAAKRWPEGIARLVLVDPFGYVPLYFKVFTLGEFGRRAYYSTFANPMGRWVTNLSLRARRKAGTNLTQPFRSVDHEVVLENLKILCATEGAFRYKGLGVPVDIAHGDRTFRAVRRSVALWREALPQAETFVLDRSGHEPIREAPEQLAAVIFRHEPQP